MEVSRFIRTVTYGGFDAADVIGRLDHLYERIYGLESRLRETDQLLESSDKGEDIKAAAETILAEEREKLTQVQVMNESFLLVTDIHEGSTERWKKFLHLSEIYISYGKTVPLAGLLVQFDQPMVFHQRDVYILGCYIDNQILLRIFRLHKEITVVLYLQYFFIGKKAVRISRSASFF